MSCAAGFINIVDAFLNPDGSVWTGSITYTLLYATTVAGATLVKARQVTNIANGVNLCLAPGIYGVSYNQSGQEYPTTSQWNVPSSGGPYTVASISQGTFPPIVAAGSDTQVQLNKAGVLGADSTLTFDYNANKTITLSGGAVSSTFTGHLIGAAQTNASPAGRNYLFVATNSPGCNGTQGVTTIRSTVVQNDDVTSPNSASIVGTESFAIVNAGCTSNWTTGASTPGGVGGAVAVRASLNHLGTGALSKSSAFRASIGGNTTGTMIDASSFRAIGPQSASLITNLTGLLVESCSATATITNNYGVLVNSLTAGTNKFSFYAVADPAYFGGGIQSPLTTPASSSAAGTAGQIEWDANFIYVCTATNTWKRATLASF